MRQVMAAGGLSCCAGVAACHRSESPGPVGAGARYTVGAPWHGDGAWFYPAAAASYDETGLAVVDLSLPAGRRTADGERYEPDRVAGAHQTLQLPVIVRVENLSNGRAMLVRLNDRGPASPGRLLSVTPRTARLLGIEAGQPAEIRVTEMPGPSQALLRDLSGAPVADAMAAPLGVVEEQSLLPGEHAGPWLASHAPAADFVASIPASLADETVTTGPARPGALWIDAGRFSTGPIAYVLARRIAGSVRQLGRGRSAVFEVRVGPFDAVSQADAALDRARSTGVTGARIIVD